MPSEQLDPVKLEVEASYLIIQVFEIPIPPPPHITGASSTISSYGPF